MALDAKKPVVKDARFKALLYANTGVGKTHFCCSLPDTYYIDTEGLEDYPHFVEMIIANNGQITYKTDLIDIIAQVQELLKVKHNFKTLIIDSISFPHGWLAQMEAERLIKKSPNTEGTEFGANLAKSKRLIYKLGILLSRLDMNIIVVSHEKSQFADGKEIGKTYDVTDKLAYALGSILNLRLMGKDRKLFIEKSRYPQLKKNEFIDFDDGYEVLKSILGEKIFTREVKFEQLITNDQLKEMKNLISVLNIEESTVNKLLTSGKANSLEELTEDFAQKAIDKLLLKLKGDAA